MFKLLLRPFTYRNDRVTGCQTAVWSLPRVLFRRGRFAVLLLRAYFTCELIWFLVSKSKNFCIRARRTASVSFRVFVPMLSDSSIRLAFRRQSDMVMDRYCDRRSVGSCRRARAVLSSKQLCSITEFRDKLNWTWTVVQMP
jgi:hypothetical protein